MPDVVLCSVRSVPPRFSIPPDSVEVLPGGSANLTCVAVGSPTPVVHWRLGSRDIDNSYVTSLSLIIVLILLLLLTL